MHAQAGERRREGLEHARGFRERLEGFHRRGPSERIRVQAGIRANVGDDAAGPEQPARKWQLAVQPSAQRSPVIPNPGLVL